MTGSEYLEKEKKEAFAKWRELYPDRNEDEFKPFWIGWMQQTIVINFEKYMNK